MVHSGKALPLRKFCVGAASAMPISGQHKAGRNLKQRHFVTIHGGGPAQAQRGLGAGGTRSNITIVAFPVIL